MHDVGTNVEAGLPNITGSFVVYTAGNYLDECKGAFTAESTGLGGESYKILGNAPEYEFDASRSNSIYGAASTVQPPAHVVQFWKRVK